LDEDVIDLMEKANVHLHLNKNTKDTIVKALTIHCSTLNQKKAMLDEFWQGAEELGLQSLLRANRGTINIMIYM